MQPPPSPAAASPAILTPAFRDASYAFCTYSSVSLNFVSSLPIFPNVVSNSFGVFAMLLMIRCIKSIRPTDFLLTAYSCSHDFSIVSYEELYLCNVSSCILKASFFRLLLNIFFIPFASGAVSGELDCLHCALQKTVLFFSLFIILFWNIFVNRISCKTKRNLFVKTAMRFRIAIVC